MLESWRNWHGKGLFSEGFSEGYDIRSGSMDCMISHQANSSQARVVCLSFTIILACQERGQRVALHMNHAEELAQMSEQHRGMYPFDVSRIEWF